KTHTHATAHPDRLPTPLIEAVPLRPRAGRRDTGLTLLRDPVAVLAGHQVLQQGPNHVGRQRPGLGTAGPGDVDPEHLPVQVPQRPAAVLTAGHRVVLEDRRNPVRRPERAPAHPPWKLAGSMPSLNPSVTPNSVTSGPRRTRMVTASPAR